MSRLTRLESRVVRLERPSPLINITVTTQLSPSPRIKNITSSSVFSCIIKIIIQYYVHFLKLAQHKKIQQTKKLINKIKSNKNIQKNFKDTHTKYSC